MLGLATIVGGRNTSNENVHGGGILGDSPGSLWDPALSVRAITRATLSLSPFREEARWLSQMMGPRSPVQALVHDSQTEGPGVILTVEKHKPIFPLDSRAHFSVIPFSSGPKSNNKVSIWGIAG
jgi:hypothetical protein